MVTRRLLALCLAGWLCATAAQAQTSYIAYEQLTVPNSSTPFTVALIEPNGRPQATVASCVLETADIRYTVDGTTTPSATVGTPWLAGTALVFTGHDLIRNFRGFRTSASSGQLNCNYTASSTVGVSSVSTATSSSGGASTVTINDPTSTGQKAAVNASGQLSITCANCSGSGASAVDESAFTQGTNSVAPMGGLFKTSYTALTSGQVGITQLTSNGGVFMNLDKIQGTNADVNSGTKSAGTLRVVLATDQPALTNKLLVTPDALPANQSVNVSQINAVTPLMGNGVTGTGSARVTIASDNTAFGVNFAQYTANSGRLPVLADLGQYTANSGRLPVLADINNPSAVDANSYAITANAASATSTLAASACNILSAASTNATTCKAAAGNLYGYELYNTSTTVYYLRLYNLSSSPTCSSATGFNRTIPIPPAASAGQVGGAVSNQIVAVNYSAGIGYCITGGSSSTDNTNAATGIFGELRYK